MRYFVTGGAGFIGSNFVEYLFENVSELTGVTIFDKFTYAANPKNYEKFLSDSRLKVIKGDICDLSLLEKSMNGNDFVIHFAAESHVDRSIDDAAVFIQTNVLGTFNVLEASRITKIKTVIHVSTDEVYGDIVEGAHTEEDLLKPSNPYSATKAAADMLISAWARTYGVPYIIVRPTNNYGIGQYTEKFIPHTIKHLSLGKKAPLHDLGLPRRTWLHASDTAAAVIKIIESGVLNETYNISGNYEEQNLVVAQNIIKLMGLKGDTEQ
jgi:dTDP-glucose 4,6-dehydratase